LKRQLDISAAEATSITLDVADVGARSLAFVIDFKIRLLLALVVALLAQIAVRFLALDAMSGPSMFARFGGLPTLLMVVPATSIYLLYHPVLETIMRGRTPGKKMAGIRVATVDGLVPGVGAIFIRNIFRMLDSAPVGYLVGLGSAFATTRGVRIGDIAAGTLLVYDQKVSSKELDKIERVSNIEGLNDVEQSVLLDLLKRWHGLDPERRAGFAKHLLTRAGVTLDDVEGRKMKIQSKLLRRKILRLANPLVDSASSATVDQKAAA